MLCVSWVMGCLVLLAGTAAAQLGGMDLLTAMELGFVRAEFRGNGDSSVVGRIWGMASGPEEVTISPGTQFWAQLGGFGAGGLGGRGGGYGQLGGGRQGMGALGDNRIRLGEGRYAQVTIPTACTNIGLPPPTRRDIMIPVRCPDPRVARVASLYGQPGVHPAAVQVAIWAICNDPPTKPVIRYLQKMARATTKAHPETGMTAEALLEQAANLLRTADVDPKLFVIFQ